MTEKYTFRPEANPFFCWFLGIFIGLLGAGLVFTGVDKVQYDPTWMIPQILFGATLVFLAWRVTQWYRRPVFALTDTAIELRPFWSLPKTIPYSDIAELGFYEQDNAVKDYTKHPAGRRTGEVVTSQHLVVRLKSGRERSIVLPRYDNHQLIRILQRRTGLTYERMQRQFVG